MEKVISKDGTPIAYLKQGDGPPLVLVHGTGVIAKSWMRVLPALAENFTVLAVDRRGRGGSGDTESYTIEREYEDIAAFVDSIDQPVNLMGHSSGGLYALEAALLANNVRRLLLYEPSITLPGVQKNFEEIIVAVEKLLNDGKKEEALVALYRMRGAPISDIERMQASPDWEERVAIADTVSREIREIEHHIFDVKKFSFLQTPTRFLVGEKHLPFFIDLIQVFIETLPDCSSDILPGQKHFAMDTAPDLFVDALTRFFKD
jgi:pimeloyl-ACP methyl ester carboxylesterase